jgi:hypothetical protein
MNNLKLRVLSLCLLLVTASPTLTPSQTPRRRATPGPMADVKGPTIWRDPEVECFTAALRDRINQLKAAAR